MKILAIRHRIKGLVLAISILAWPMAGCGGDPPPPLERILASMGGAPEYSIVLENMKTEGNFFKSYFHKYRVIKGGNAELTDWTEVPDAFYKTNEPFLGMVIAGLVNGERIDAPEPPGYRYVGNPRYGRWVRNAAGDSEWAFNNQYSYMPGLYGGWFSPVIELDIDDFWKHKKKYKRSKPYYGRKAQFGTKGKVVKKAKPDFYSRYTAKSNLKKSSFTDRVNKRVGRTRTGLRSRAGGRGK